LGEDVSVISVIIEIVSYANVRVALSFLLLGFGNSEPFENYRSAEPVEARLSAVALRLETPFTFGGLRLDRLWATVRK
jgi:hypothetical protein